MSFMNGGLSGDEMHLVPESRHCPRYLSAPGIRTIRETDCAVPLTSFPSSVFITDNHFDDGEIFCLLAEGMR